MIVTHKDNTRTVHISDISYTFQRGFISYLTQEHDGIENKTVYSSDRIGFDFAAGKYENIKIKKGVSLTLEEFKREYADWIEKEMSYYIKVKEAKIEREKVKELLKLEIEKNIHKENRNTKPKTWFQIQYGNKYYLYNDKIHQIICAKISNEVIQVEYIEKPSNKKCFMPVVCKFVIAKIQKPSGRCTEIKIPYEQFVQRKFFVSREALIHEK